LRIYYENRLLAAFSEKRCRIHLDCC